MRWQTVFVIAFRAYYAVKNLRLSSHHLAGSQFQSAPSSLLESCQTLLYNQVSTWQGQVKCVCWMEKMEKRSLTAYLPTYFEAQRFLRIMAASILEFDPEKL